VTALNLALAFFLSYFYKKSDKIEVIHYFVVFGRIGKEKKTQIS